MAVSSCRSIPSARAPRTGRKGIFQAESRGVSPKGWEHRTEHTAQGSGTGGLRDIPYGWLWQLARPRESSPLAKAPADRKTPPHVKREFKKLPKHPPTSLLSFQTDPGFHSSHGTGGLPPTQDIFKLHDFFSQKSCIVSCWKGPQKAALPFPQTSFSQDRRV